MLVDAISVIVRGLSFIAIFQAAGMAIFLQRFGAPLSDATRARLRKTLIRSAVAALLFVAAHFMLEPARMGGELAAIVDPALLGMAFGSTQALVLACKLLGLALLIGGTMRSTRGGSALALIGAALVLGAFALLGHTATSPARPLLAALLLAHLAIAAFWFGAMPTLLRIARDEPLALAGEIVARFSRTAVWLVPLLAMAGLVMAAVLLGSLRALLTPYGSLLLCKLGLFAALMALAALNRWRFGPALAAAETTSRRAFCRTVIWEYALIAAVLMITALLTGLFSPDP
jgi:putative copper export protein